MSKIQVEQTHSQYIITIPSADVWADAFLMVVVKLLERYDPADERAEYHRRLAEQVNDTTAFTIPPELQPMSIERIVERANEIVEGSYRYKCGECGDDSIGLWSEHQAHYESHRAPSDEVTTDG